MKTCSALACAVLLLGAVAAGRSPAGPPSHEEGERRAKLAAQLKASLAAETTAAGKFAVLARAMKAEPSPDGRRTVLDAVPPLPGPELDTFLTGVLTADPDAGVRSLAAAALGKTGSEKCLPALATAAGTDRTTAVTTGDIGGRSSARRAATFAIAELAARFPKLADDAAARLRALNPPADPKDAEGLADARLQALYQVTRDAALLAPFYERLRSKDARVRIDGVVAFRALELTTAPAEVVAAIKDADGEVRSWAALVLGEIGDPKAVPALLAAAADAKETHSVRCNAIWALGRIRAAAAAEPLRKLLADDNGSVRTAAAIALFRVTGERTKDLPAGYKEN